MTTRHGDRKGLSVAVWAIVGGVMLYLGWAVGVIGVGHAGTTAVALTLASIIVVISQLVTTQEDRRWLPQLIMAAFGLKLLASGMRYWVLVSVYNRVGDAVGYHKRGLRLADAWRAFENPEFQIQSASTTFASKATGLVYAPYEPSMLGGFFMFAFIAFIGQMLLYFAYRRAVGQRLVGYAAAIFLMPTLLFWPSSIGKESLMLLFIGLVAYGAARIYDGFHLKWVALIGVGLAGAGGVRPHIAAMLVGGIAVGILLGRSTAGAASQARRFVLIGIGAVVTVVFIGQVEEKLGFDLSLGADLDPLFAELEDQTGQGGSAVEGEPLTNLAAVPGSVLRVLYRPFPHEAHNVQALLSALEGTALLVFTIWRLPSVVRNLRYLRRYPYLLFSLVFLIAFVMAFSTFLNLGILARQRSQVYPALFALLIGFGWKVDPWPRRQSRELPESPTIGART